LVASQSKVQEIQHPNYKHHFCRSNYELRSTLDQDNPAGAEQR